MLSIVRKNVLRTYFETLNENKCWEIFTFTVCFSSWISHSIIIETNFGWTSNLFFGLFELNQYALNCYRLNAANEYGLFRFNSNKSEWSLNSGEIRWEFRFETCFATVCRHTATRRSYRASEMKWRSIDSWLSVLCMPETSLLYVSIEHRTFTIVTKGAHQNRSPHTFWMNHCFPIDWFFCFYWNISKFI